MSPADANGRPRPPVLQPTAYSAETTSPPAAARERAALSHLLAYALVALLAVVAVASVYLLPRWVTSVEETPPAVASPAPAPAPAPPPDPILSPKQMVEARLAAQDDLATLLARMDALRMRHVERWAGAEFKTAEQHRIDGETAYREQRYPAARAAYAEAATAVSVIEAAMPGVVARHVADGEQALANGDSRAARDAFTAARELAPDRPAAQRGLRRAQSLDRVLALVQEAQGYERLGDPARASATYREALALDEDATAARDALARLTAAARQAAFGKAMSDGYAALEAERYDAAKTAFERARTLDPKASEASHALAQTATRATAARVARAMADAARAEREERWIAAVDHFRAALAVDGTLDTAQQGVTRAGHRAALDAVLERLLSRPDRLGEEAVHREAQVALGQARAITGPGSRLRSQIERLDRAATDARTPIAVTLRSDGATEVAVSRAGVRGRFDARQVALFPGRYTATGRREGYRDVRIDFTVNSGAAPPVVTVMCTEAIAFGTQ